MGRKIIQILVVLVLIFWILGENSYAEETMQEIQFFYEKDSGKEYIISSEEIQVEMRAPEGTQKIYYQLGGQAYACLNGENVSVTVPIGFQGKIGAYFIDRTGTQSNVFFSKEIICENQSPNVVMTLPQGFEVWYHHAITTEIEIEEQGACSGIKSIRCLVNGVEMQKKIYGEREKMKEHLSVPIDKTSVTVVKVEDWAGNCDTIERNVLFDAQSPQVKFEGMENHMITNETKEICCMVSDEQELPVLKGNITWVNPDGIAVSKVIEHWEKEGAWYVAREKIEEEGTYEIEIEAEDRAKNQTRKKWKVMIDKTSPTIHGIEQFDGKQIPFFEWTKDSSEVIEDFTTCTYRIYLDGRNCKKNYKYTEEGKHVLEIFAIDAAGNESRKKATFQIKHVPIKFSMQKKKEKYASKKFFNKKNKKEKNGKAKNEKEKNKKEKNEKEKNEKGKNKREKNKKGKNEKEKNKKEKYISCESGKNLNEKYKTYIWIVFCGILGLIGSVFMVKKVILEREDAE